MGEEETLQWLLVLVYCSLLGRQLSGQGFLSQPVLLLCGSVMQSLMDTAARASALVLHPTIPHC